MTNLFFHGFALPAAPPSAGHIRQAVRDKVQREGRARVIVELRLPAGFVAEENLRAFSSAAVQRNAIAAIQRNLIARLARTPGRVVYEYQSVPLLALDVDAGALAELENAGSEIASVVEDKLNAPKLAQSVPLIQADQAWADGYDGTGQVVAILDTGVDSSHPFLTGKVVREACFSSNYGPHKATTVCPNGQTQQTGAGAGQDCPLPDCAHGTHVAGIAAGEGAGAGVSFSGVAPGAGIMAIQVFTKINNPTICGSGNTPCVLAYDSDLIKALEHVYSLRTQLAFSSVNMSLGGGGTTNVNCDNDPLKPIIDNLRAAGIATVIAAGNDDSRDGISSPACISSAVSVGSTTDADTVSSFSNVAAILSLLAPGSSINSSVPGSGFSVFNGTSMATPHVAGAWAILRQAVPDGTVEEILAALQQSGLPVTDTRSGGTFIKPRIRIADALDLFPLDFTLTVALAGGGTVNSSIAGIACGSDCDEIYPRGTSVTLTPVPDSGFVFAGFSGDADCSDGVVKMNADKSCTAVFSLPLAIAAAGMPVGEKGVAYSGDLQISGGVSPYTVVRIQGTLPRGLAIGSDGIISGTPIGLAKTYSFKVSVRDQFIKSTTKSFKISIAGFLRIANKALKTGQAGASYSALLKARGGRAPYSWSIASGVLPAGLSLDGGTGAITGTPTQPGSFTMSVQVVDPLGGLAAKSLTIKIN